MGKPFKLVLPFANGDQTGGVGSAIYSYKDGQLLLDVSTTNAEPGGEPVIVGADRTMSSSSYVGQNSYGARARVVSKTALAQGVALISAPPGEQRSAYSERQTSLEPHDYWYRATLSGPEAKAIAHDADLVIEGTMAPLSNGKAAACLTSTVDATIGNPDEGLFLRCYAGANVRRVAFIRRSTGAVLREWAGDPTP